MIPSKLTQLIRLGLNGQLPMAWHATWYNWKARRLNRRFARTPSAGTFQALGQVNAVAQHPHGIVLSAEHAWVEIVAVAPDIMRVRLGVPDRTSRVPHRQRLVPVGIRNAGWPHPQ